MSETASYRPPISKTHSQIHAVNAEQTKAQRSAQEKEERAIRHRTAEAIRNNLALLEAHEFPVADTIEVVRPISAWKSIFHRQGKTSLIPVEFTGVVMGRTPGNGYGACGTRERAGYLLVKDSTLGYPFATYRTQQNKGHESEFILLSDGQLAYRALPDRRPSGWYSDTHSFSFVEPSQSFAARQCIGAYEGKAKLEGGYSEWRVKLDVLQEGAERLDNLINQLGIAATEPQLTL